MERVLALSVSGADTSCGRNVSFASQDLLIHTLQTQNCLSREGTAVFAPDAARANISAQRQLPVCVYRCEGRGCFDRGV